MVAVAVYRVLVLTHAAPTGSVLMVAHGSGGDGCSCGSDHAHGVG